MGLLVNEGIGLEFVRDDIAMDMLMRFSVRKQWKTLTVSSYRRNRLSSNEVLHQLIGESSVDSGFKFRRFGVLLAKESL